METKKAKTTVLVSLLALAVLAVIFLPTYADEPEPIAQPEPKLHRVHKMETIKSGFDKTSRKMK
jgi:Spy/CpxP family protein refolding chaperone